MDVLLWLAVPIAVTALVAAWMSRRNRSATPEQQQQGIHEMERFRAALSKPLPKRDH